MTCLLQMFTALYTLVNLISTLPFWLVVDKMHTIIHDTLEPVGDDPLIRDGPYIW